MWEDPNLGYSVESSVDSEGDHDGPDHGDRGGHGGHGHACIQCTETKSGILFFNALHYS